VSAQLPPVALGCSPPLSPLPPSLSPTNLHPLTDVTPPSRRPAHGAPPPWVSMGLPEPVTGTMCTCPHNCVCMGARPCVCAECRVACGVSPNSGMVGTLAMVVRGPESVQTASSRRLQQGSQCTVGQYRLGSLSPTGFVAVSSATREWWCTPGVRHEGVLVCGRVCECGRVGLGV
jgi:hypothetical protein